MASSRRFTGPVALATLLLVPAALAMPARPPIGDLAAAGLEARAAGDSPDGAVAALLDRAAAEPARAGEIAAALLLLDRNDDALGIMLSAGRNAEAVDLLIGQWRHDEAMAAALGAVADAPVARSRQFLAPLWPARAAAAEAAWTWLVRRGDVSSADEALVRVNDILDSARPSKDADMVLSAGASLLAGASPCEQARLGAGLIDLAHSRGRSDAALEIAKTWVSVADSASAWGMLGEVLARESQWSAAADAYGHAADLQPAEGGARWLQAAMLRKAGDIKGAAAAQRRATDSAAQPCSRLRLAQAMSLAGDRADAASLRGQVLGDEGSGTQQTSLAAARLRAAHGTLAIGQVLPLIRRIQSAELEAIAARGDVDAALRLAEHALEPFLSQLDATADIVLSLRAADRAVEADALLARVAERVAQASEASPHATQFLNARAWLAARTRDGLAEGLAAAERAAELAPSNAGILDTLAEVRFQLGDRAGALRVAERALALQPERAYLQLQAERFASGDPATPPSLELD